MKIESYKNEYTRIDRWLLAGKFISIEKDIDIRFVHTIQVKNVF